MNTRKRKGNKKNKKKNTIKRGGGQYEDFLNWSASASIFIGELFTGKMAQGFLFIFKYLGLSIIWGFQQLWKCLCWIWKDISTKGVDSIFLRISLIIIGVLTSFSLVGIGLTATGAVNVFGHGGIIPTLTTNMYGWINGINIFNVFGAIITILFNTLSYIVEDLFYLLFTSSTTIISLSWSIILAGVIGLLIAFITNEYESTVFVDTYKKTKNYKKVERHFFQK